MLDCVVIGAGQAGLAASHHLHRLGIEHVVLERGQVAETWRRARWDGFHLNTPNWATRLPGLELPGVDPDAFAPRAEVVGFLERYAGEIAAPVRAEAPVTGLRHTGSRFELAVDGETVEARSVIAASGAYQQPTSVPERWLAAAPGVLQLHTSAYRRPSQLPPGGVLIVGNGQSGCEIGQELLDAGRAVHLAVGRCPWAPRRHRGRDLIRWFLDVGMMDDTLDRLPSPAARVAGNVTVSGAKGGKDCDPLILEAAGAELHGRLTAIEDGRATFADDLARTLAKGLELERDLRARFDRYALAEGLHLPVHVPPDPPRRAHGGRTEVDLEAAGVTTVLWANGYRPAFAWIDLPIFDDLGFPVTRRGVTDVPGLAFVGLPWMHTRRSPLLLGVGEDAAHVAEATAVHLGELPARAR
jgi:putative flavoprotein involved in K+ transport